MNVAAGDDSQAAQGKVEIVAMEQQPKTPIYRVIFRVHSPNKTEVRCAEIAMQKQGFTYWHHKRELTTLLTTDGWMYLFGIFVKQSAK